MKNHFNQNILHITFDQNQSQVVSFKFNKTLLKPFFHGLTLENNCLTMSVKTAVH